MVSVKNNSGLAWKKEHVIECDDKFSAMQKCTAFPISTIASMMAEGIFDDRKDEKRGYYINLPNILAYSDIPFDEFNKRLASLGLSLFVLINICISCVLMTYNF
jgi:hypothetical protein